MEEIIQKLRNEESYACQQYEHFRAENDNENKLVWFGKYLGYKTALEIIYEETNWND